MDSKIFPALNPQRWDGAKPYLTTCVREGRTGAFTSLFFVCTSAPCLCCMACSVLCLQGKATRGTFAASKDIATGALPAWQIWLPILYLQPLCLWRQHFRTSMFELYLKAAAAWDSEYRGRVPKKGTDTASLMQPSPPRARRSAGTMVPGSCMECCPCTQHGQQGRREQPITELGETRICGYGEREWTTAAQHSSLLAFLVLSVTQASALHCPAWSLPLRLNCGHQEFKIVRSA